MLDRVLVCGANSQFQIALSPLLKNVNKPIQVDTDKFNHQAVTHVACGDNHTIFITSICST
jgi:alpha-tubulin suppressor-like RCC1 family protein